MSTRTSLPLHPTEAGDWPWPKKKKKVKGSFNRKHKDKDKHQKTTYKRGPWRRTKACRRLRGGGYSEACSAKKSSDVA